MADAARPASDAPLRFRGAVNRLAASRRFQAICARIPGLRGLVRREGAALFDLMQGFVQSQTLAALVELRVLETLANGPMPPARLAPLLALPEPRLKVLLQAGAAMGLLRRHGARFGLSRRGAAFLSLPALPALVRHHKVLYDDLRDPVAFFMGATDPDLARFWPYVFGGRDGMDAESAARYSRLMADSQALVAEEALATLSFRGVRRVMDVGGGTGAFLRALKARHPDLDATLFDLPDVVVQAVLPAGVTRIGGSFRDQDLPVGADMITLVRVLYDHSDATVRDLLARAFAALPPGGRIAVIEPMSGGARPDPQTDVYFAVYTMAMQTGRTRSAAEIGALLVEAGFKDLRAPRAQRPVVTAVIEAHKPGASSSN